MKVAWVHTFPSHPSCSGVFMHVLADGVRRQGIDIRMIGAHAECRSWRILCPSPDVKHQARTCDLVHAQYGSGCAMFSSRLAGRRVVTLRGSDWYGWDLPTFTGRLHWLLSRKMTRACLRRFDMVITVSDRMRAEVLQEMPDLRCESLPSGVDLACFKPMNRADARRFLGAGEDSSPWVLFSSVLGQNPLKRQWLAQAAVRELQRVLPQVKLKTLTGRPHDEVPVFINACDVLLMTSTHEGWPNIVKESLACNVPFVSTDVSDLADIVRVEPTCHLADASPEALARCLAEVLSRPRPSDLRRHVEHMALPLIATRLVRLYEDVLDGQR